MKRFLIVIFILCVGTLYAQTPKKQGVIVPRKVADKSEVKTDNQAPNQEEYTPILGTVNNSVEEQNKILANTYPLAVYDKDNPPSSLHPGGGTAFRIHRNWFLTCAHGPFMKINTQQKPFLNIGISVQERPDAPGTSDPYFLVIDTAVTDENANGKVYFLRPDLQLTSSNDGRGDDIALIYVSDKDPSEMAFKKANNEIKKMKEQIKKLNGMLSVPYIEQMEKNISIAHKKASTGWTRFMNQKINPFHLLILSEKNIIDELGYKNVKPYLYRLTAYHILDGFKKFNFTPIGTHAGTHAIFYERVNNLISGTSGGPMAYGNFIVSIVSATNCSPMFTDTFYDWLKGKMGADYNKGMCVKPNPPQNGEEVPVEVETDRHWNDASPANPGPLHPHHP